MNLINICSKATAFICLLAIAHNTAAWGQTKAQAIKPTITDMAYGSHERQKLDFFKATSDHPTPLMVFIHGGGWLNGDKQTYARKNHKNLSTILLNKGISAAFINYRLSTDAILPAPVIDAARAIQFLRAKASELNIDPKRIAAAGQSAGGCTSLWLATHDDLAQPNSDDPIARQSTRLCGAWVTSAQTTIEPASIRKWIGEFGLKHHMICKAAGFKNNKDMDQNYATKADLYREFSPINHLTADDPPMLLYYGSELDKKSDGIHHAQHGLHFKNKADQVKAKCYLKLPKHRDMFPNAPKLPTFFDEIFNSPQETSN
tara:strand:- start:76595 stop:77545 length:951 start_codon:yes stop_codon:yes gene_type:complete